MGEAAPKQEGFGAFKMGAQPPKPAEGGAFGGFKMTAEPVKKDDKQNLPVE